MSQRKRERKVCLSKIVAQGFFRVRSLAFSSSYFFPVENQFLRGDKYVTHFSLLRGFWMQIIKAVRDSPKKRLPTFKGLFLLPVHFTMFIFFCGREKWFFESVSSRVEFFWMVKMEKMAHQFRIRVGSMLGVSEMFCTFVSRFVIGGSTYSRHSLTWFHFFVTKRHVLSQECS